MPQSIMEKIGKENKMRNVRENFPQIYEKRMKMKIKNLIKQNETEHNLFLLNQINEDYNEMKFLLQCLKHYEAELKQIEIEIKSCGDIREMAVIEAHYNNVMNKCNECDARIEKLVKRCERRKKVLNNENK